MKKSLLLGLIISGLAVMMVSSATAQSSDDPVSTGDGTSVTGGEVAQQDVGVTTTTNDWAGLFGQITTGKVLESSGGTFFEWSAAEPSSMKYVYAVTDGTAPDSSITAESDPSNLITSDGGADSADNTYSSTSDFDGLGFDNGISTSSVQTFDSEGNGSWTTFLLNDGGDNPVFAAEANANSDGFNGNSVDYQMLLPDQDGSGTNYDFYVELE